ncbi:MAG: DUF996 domain-containing protein [Nitrososphaerota archaeon]|jgi:uncharacterized membrane protein|nr:DUF996 domain-containing protein [Nitrososphaerota archaeon]
MTTFESSKILAGIGSILYGTIIGIIFVLIGMKGLSEHYNDRRIYDGLVTGAILLIISSILATVGISVLYAGIFATAATYGMAVGLGILGVIGCIVCFIVGVILALLAVRHVRNCFHALAERSGENLFNTAGTLIWIGAILIIIGVGFFLIWIGFIIAAVGFFTLKSTPTQPTYNYTPPPPNSQPPPTQPYQAAPASNIKANFCPNCGTTVAPEATFCTQCGKQI